MEFTKNIKWRLATLAFWSVLLVSGQAKSNKFTIVLDAGHGGKDPGNSYHGYVEKDIALKTTLKVGEFLEKEKDFEVVFTRKSDVFIELVNRPKVANKINANLFVSIHCNSVKNFEPEGTETFVMGLSRSNMNLEVAKNENSVILLEDNYKKTYEGFNPNNPESLIGLKIMQEENLYNSINLASHVQENFTNNLNRKTRGVKQQPLWVLDAASMPGVLIELGFLSNKEEGEFLNSDEGQTKMARQIANAIISYKRSYFNESGPDSERIAEKETKNQDKETKAAEKEVKVAEKTVDRNDKPQSKDSDSSKVVKTTVASNVEAKTELYKVQLFASSKKRDPSSKEFKGLKEISFTFENNLYRYYYGASSDMEEAKKMQNEAKNRGFSNAFIVTFAAGKS
ncbi:N-acetylmuramoyl-L-alanine amidase [Flavobacterium sp. XGLA_31]|uniref:N-acetylmuramoyl-L-alanine amidase n=1 Tax=Flavobacterium sp. XGLA_31 TaxID=3447666 RepID=UPI003F3192E3